MPDPTEPVITSDGSLTLHSERYRETYHSVHGAATESMHVYLEGGGVMDAFKQRQLLTDPPPIRVLEVGLGLGVNAMLTAEQAELYGVPVEYIGIEHDFQPLEVIRSVLATRPASGAAPESETGSGPDRTPIHRPISTQQLADAIERFCAAVDTTATRTAINSQFQLRIMNCDIQQALETLLHTEKGRIDAVYLDAFSPDSNPECWTTDILAKLGETLSSNGRLTTYCAKGSVRRALQEVGLTVTRRPGPPGKRECLVAY